MKEHTLQQRGDRQMSEEAIRMADTKTLSVGEKVQFAEDKPTVKYTVRAASSDGRYAICTRPYNPRRTAIYTIVDFGRGVRGPDNLVFSIGYETPEQIAESMALLESGGMEVSWRTSRYLSLNFRDEPQDG